MKRQKWGIVAVVAALCLTGCGSTELTDKQNGEAAEYIAGVLLKHSKNYDRSLIYPTPIATSSSSPEVTEVSATKAPVSTASSETSGKVQGEKAEGEAGISATFEQVFAMDGIKISYKGKKECVEYKEKGSKSYAVYAESGKKLVVVSFQLTNNSGKVKKVDLMKKQMTYHLITSDGKSYEAQKTFFSEDMNFLSAKIKGGKTKKGLLVFMLPKKTPVKNSQIQISNGSASATKSIG